MPSKRCFKRGCKNEVQYTCPCLFPQNYLCEFHLEKHCKLPNRNHSIDSIFLEPSQGTKDLILNILVKEKSKKKKLRKKILKLHSQKDSERSHEESLRKLDTDSSEICGFIEKISQARKISKLEEDPVLKLLLLQPEDAALGVKEMILENPHKSDKQSDKLSYIMNKEIAKIDESVDNQNHNNALGSQINSNLDDLNNKIREIDLFSPQDWESKKIAVLSKPNNPETERGFRATCSLYEKQCSTFNQPFSQHYHQYLKNYHQITSLYLTKIDGYCSTELIIYDTESEREEERILDTSQPLQIASCITQLPNGELFCYSRHLGSWITLIIDSSYRIKILSSKPCNWSSSTYYKNNVYCFGGFNDHHCLSCKFDLIENRWTNLAPMPQNDKLCSSVIFNENILISGRVSKNLLLYSICIDSFSTIPYEFAEKKRKILINIERLYLIECGNGLIYESQDGYNWKQISKSIIDHCTHQIYCSYNKGGIYIAKKRLMLYAHWEYYKFDLNKKVMTRLGERN